MVAFLDRVRARAGIATRAEVATENSVPTASGLASSASGFAALALAASRAAGLQLSQSELSELARLGSGSAARSIFGGFVEMARGERADGRDAVASPLALRDDGPPWDLRLVVAITAAGEKAEGSTSAMDRTARTSPFFPAWVASVPADLAEARAAIAAHDLARLGAVAERSALRMHATALAADPAIVYWNGATVAAIHATRALARTRHRRLLHHRRRSARQGAVRPGRRRRRGRGAGERARRAADHRRVTGARRAARRHAPLRAARTRRPGAGCASEERAVRTTLRGSPVVAAPGKVFLVGEYGVLEGGTSVLAAVNRVAVGEFIPELDAGSPLVAQAVKTTLAALGEKGSALPAGSVWIDTGAFAAGGEGDDGGGVRKLGLGSSAATAACAVGAVLEMAGLPIAGHRDLAFSLAESAHRAWQGGAGSGADVAAAVYGGVLQFTRPGGGAPVVRNIPGGLGTLQLVVFSSPTAVSTTQPDPLDARVRRARARPLRRAAGAGARGRGALRPVAGVATRARDDRVAARGGAGADHARRRRRGSDRDPALRARGRDRRGARRRGQALGRGRRRRRRRAVRRSARRR